LMQYKKESVCVFVLGMYCVCVLCVCIVCVYCVCVLYYVANLIQHKKSPAT